MTVKHFLCYWIFGDFLGLENGIPRDNTAPDWSSSLLILLLLTEQRIRLKSLCVWHLLCVMLAWRPRRRRHGFKFEAAKCLRNWIGFRVPAEAWIFLFSLEGRFGDADLQDNFDLQMFNCEKCTIIGYRWKRLQIWSRQGWKEIKTVKPLTTCNKCFIARVSIWMVWGD